MKTNKITKYFLSKTIEHIATNYKTCEGLRNSVFYSKKHALEAFKRERDFSDWHFPGWSVRLQLVVRYCTISDNGRICLDKNDRRNKKTKIIKEFCKFF